ncbi:MAG: Ig-like domain-containing protein, partial [Planctomycetota bacterium]
MSTYGQGTVTITAEDADGSGVSASLSVSVTNPVLMSLTVSPTSATVAMGMTRTYLATGTYSDGSTSAATVDWTVDDSNIATVDATGVVTGMGQGSALITATSTDRPEIFATASMTVVAAVPVSLFVTPDPASVDAGSTVGFTAAASMSDGSTTTPSVVWTSSDHNMASIDASGQASGLTAGTVTITATSTIDSTLSGSATLTVNAPVLVSLTIQPDPASVMVLQTVTLSATGHYSDNSTAPETVTWASDDTNIATVDGSGTVTGMAVGTANITATAVSDTSVAATVSLTVRPPFDYLYLNCAYYTSGVGIMRVPYAGGAAQTFSTAKRFNTNGMCLSPDRSKMYLLDKTGTIDEIDMSTGNMTRIYTNQSYNAGQSFVSLSCDPQGNLYTFYTNGGNVVYQIDPVNRTRTTFCTINGQTALFDSHFFQGELYVCFWGGIAKAAQGGTLSNIYNGSVITSIDMDPQGNF